MTRTDLNKRARFSFLASLILHIMVALVLGLVLLEQPKYGVEEFVAVDMVEISKRIMPIRRPEVRESVPELRSSRKQKAKTQFKPGKLKSVETNFTRQPRSSNTLAIFPELATNVSRLRSRFDMPLPGPTGATITKPGTSTKRSTGVRSGAISIGLAGEAGMFETALYWIARNIVGKNKTGKEDIVFLVDASGSMEENIAAVARYIGRMNDVFEKSDLDYTMGVVRFNRVLKKNDIQVYKQIRDANQIKAILRSIQCDGNERTFDAIEVGLAAVEFRHPVDKTFILVTDEAFTPRTRTMRARKRINRKDVLNEDFREIVKMCQNDGVKVSVLGIENEMHRLLAKETGGLWFQIPQQDNLP